MQIPSGENRLEDRTEGGKFNEDNRSWQTAGDRVLLYLRCLNYRAPRAFELALKALEKAKENLESSPGDNSPVAESMRILRRLLIEEEGGEGDLSRDRLVQLDAVVSMPPVHRRSMRAAELGAVRWISLLRGLAGGLKEPQVEQGQK